MLLATSGIAVMFVLNLGVSFSLSLYTALRANPQDKAWADDVYKKARERYHPLTQKNVDKQFAKEGK